MLDFVMNLWNPAVDAKHVTGVVTGLEVAGRRSFLPILCNLSLSI